MDVIADNNQKTITVADMIAHLMTFPPGMEVWTTWDESGEYWPAKKPQARIDHVKEVEICGRKQWRERPDDAETKAVCILGAEIKL